MASFYIPLTGLTSDSTALNTIANDLANMNTTGFKSQSVNFSDLFYQQIGSSGAGQSDPGWSRHAGGFHFHRFHGRIAHFQRNHDRCSIAG